MHQSRLNKTYEHDTFKFIPPSFERTNTFNSAIANRYPCTSIPISNNYNRQTEQPVTLGESLTLDSNTNPVKTTIRDIIPIEASKHSCAENISGLPSSITYSSDTLFVMCQLRRGNNDTINNELARLHNDGSAPRFLETLITASFLARPTTSTLHSQLRIRQIKYESMRNLTPTYSISLGTLLKTTGNNPTYARHGTPTFNELQSYIHDFVFERWHTTDALDVETYQDVLSESSSPFHHATTQNISPSPS